MGEIADAMINGEFCMGCGEYLGEETGYPGYCSGCKPKSSHKKKKIKVIVQTKGSIEPKDVKVGGKYLFQGMEVTVIERVFTTAEHRQRFLLSNGLRVKANKLEKIET